MASCPGAGRTFCNTDAAAYAFFFITDNFIIFHFQDIDREFIAAFDTGTAGHTAGRIVLRKSHADDAEIMHTGFDTGICAACKSNFKMQIIGKDCVFDPSGEGGSIIISKRTDAVSDASTDIACAGCGVSGSGSGLVDLEIFNNRLKFLIYFIDIFQSNAFNLKTLACSPSRQM